MRKNQLAWFFVLLFMIKDLFGANFYSTPIANVLNLPSGKGVIFSVRDFSGLFLLSFENNELQNICDNVDAGYGANISPDGKRMGFKYISKDGKQTPVFFDLEKEEIISLTTASDFTGVPTFSENGRIAFTKADQLNVLDRDMRELYLYQLGSYSNLTPISPDGKKVVYNDLEDQFWILDLQTGAKIKLTNSELGYFFPRWSPDSKKIAARSLTGDVYVFEIDELKSFSLGHGESINWLEDSQHLIFCQQERNNREEIIKSQPVVADYQNGKIKPLMSSDQIVASVHYSQKTNKLIFLQENSLQIHEFNIEKRQLRKKEQIEIDVRKLKTNLNESTPFLTVDSELKALESFDAPYLHQVYDTPNWFNGHWACGATSAVMALAYYQILPVWTCNCSSPYFHVSNYGRYICEVYDFNNYTFDVGGLDPNGTMAYGGYGFIIQDNWADTKGNMAKYVRRHGLGSSVDWYPNFSKLVREVDNESPVVILNSLTSAGHYILGTGYYQTQRGVVVNDPYGNKNYGYVNYQGKGAIYDWPGYSNGRANLNTVHCFIYMRNACDLVMSEFSLPDTLTVGQTFNLELKIRNQGKKVSDSSGVSLYLSSNSYFNQSDRLLDTITIPQIEKDDSLLINVDVHLPDSLPSSKWAIGAWIDEQDHLIENSKNNNLFYDVFVLKGFPLLYGFSPFPDATTHNAMPEIIARFKDDYFGILNDSIRISVDEKDVTQFSDIQANKITYTPEDEMSTGWHVVEVSVVNKPGYNTQKKWRFQVQTTAVAENRPSEKKSYHLSQNYPNPFNSSTNIQYQLEKPGFVKIAVYSINGELIRYLINEFQQKGTHKCTWDGRNESNRMVASGLYFYQILTQDYKAVQRMIFIR